VLFHAPQEHPSLEHFHFENALTDDGASLVRANEEWAKFTPPTPSGAFQSYIALGAGLRGCVALPACLKPLFQNLDRWQSPAFQKFQKGPARG